MLSAFVLFGEFEVFFFSLNLSKQVRLREVVEECIRTPLTSIFAGGN